MNSNQNISSIIVKTLANLGCKDACISPGARNSCLAFDLGNRINSYNVLDERSAGYMALGIAKYTNTPVIVNCTSGTALSNLYPSIIEARMSETPMIILTADRPQNIIDKGENQTIYQENIYGKYVLTHQSIDSSSVNIEDIIYAAYNTSIGLSDGKPLHEKGPVHINVHLSEPNSSDDLQSYSMNTNFRDINPVHIENPIKIKDFKKPLIICGQSNLKAYESEIFKLSEELNIPILSDISSNINSHPNKVSYYDTFIDSIKPDTIFRFGKKPLSKTLNQLIKNCSNLYLIRDERIFNDDASDMISYHQLSDFIDSISINLDPSWANSIKEEEKVSISKIDDLINKTKYLNEYTIAYQVLNQIESSSNIFIGNSIIIRAFNLLYKNINQQNINIFSNRGASGIDGNIATSIGMAAASTLNHNYLILGDQAFMHDIGSLKILKDLNINLTIIVINNSGGGIFDYLPISNQDNISSYKQFIRSDHNDTFKEIVEAYKINYIKIDTLSDFNLPLDKKVNVLEVRVDRTDSLDFYQKLTT